MHPSRKVAVVGAGIIGISSALRAIETVPGIEVTLIADKFTPNTTGDGSAGFWNPYLLGDGSPSAIRFWCEKTFEFLLDLYKSPQCSDYGVGLLSAYYLSETPMETPYYADIFLEYRNMNEKELALFPEKYRYGAFSTTLYVECTKLIPMFMKRYQSKGGKIVQKKLRSLSELAGKFDVVINCPGVHAAKLVPDPSVFPIRGQVMRVRAPWIKNAILGGDDYYILPNTDEVICGGTHQEGNWNTEVDPVDTDTIWRGCKSLVPSLKNAKILKEWVGLRPGRSEPRLERQTLTTKNGKLEIIHNYGHGGSGVTLFWGCAIQATNLLQETLSRTHGPSKL